MGTRVQTDERGWEMVGRGRLGSTGTFRFSVRSVTRKEVEREEYTLKSETTMTYAPGALLALIGMGAAERKLSAWMTS
jgi:hypothetical protein